MTISTTANFSMTTCFLVAFGLLCSSASLANAQGQNKKKGAKVVGLKQLAKEVRTVKWLKPGDKSGKLTETKVKVHTLYQTDAVEAFIDTLGHLYIQPKVEDPGGTVSGTMKVHTRFRYLDKNDNPNGMLKGRKILKVISSTPPGKNTRRVPVLFELSDGVKVEMTYSFDGKVFNTDMNVKDPARTKDDTQSFLELLVPPSHDIAVRASDREKEEATAGCMLKMKGQDRDYASLSKSSGKNRVSSATILGHWPGCEVTMKGRPGVGLYVYGAKSLYKGYLLITNDPNKYPKKKSLSVAVVKKK